MCDLMHCRARHCCAILSYGVQRLKAKAVQPSSAQASKGYKGAMQQGRAVGRRSPVPDFKRLHAAWESRLADTKAANRATATKPEVGMRHCLALCHTTAMPAARVVT